MRIARWLASKVICVFSSLNFKLVEEQIFDMVATRASGGGVEASRMSQEEWVGDVDK